MTELLASTNGRRPEGSLVPLLALFAATAAVALVAYHGVVDLAFLRDDYVWLFDARAQAAEPWTILTHRPNGFFRPLANGLFALESSVFGEAPLGFLVVNVALHVWTAVWLGVLARALTGAWTPAFVAATLFAGFARTWESVTWISSLVTLLAAAMILPALVAYHRRLVTGSRPAGLVAVVFAAAALASKETGVVVLPLFGLLEVTHGGWGALRSASTWRRLAPTAALFVAYLVAQLSFLQDHADRAGIAPEELACGWFGGTLQLTSVVLTPIRTSPLGVADIWISVAVLLLAPLVARGVTGRWGFETPLRLWLALLVVTAPFVPILGVRLPLADRYTYLPTLVGCLALGVTLGALHRTRPRLRTLGFGATAVVAVASALAAADVVAGRPVADSLATRAVADWFDGQLLDGATPTPPSGTSWLLAGYPFRTARHLAHLAAVHGGLANDAVTRTEVTAAELAPPGTDGERVDVGALLDAHGCTRIFAYRPGEGVVEFERGNDVHARRLAQVLGVRWRREREHSPLLLHVLRF